MKKYAAVYERGGRMYARMILAEDEEQARRVFYSARLGYAGCGINDLRIEEWERKHEWTRAR